jgi:hypothetical protein
MSLVTHPPLKCPIQFYANNQFAYVDHAGLDVIRTVWLAALCLTGLGAMVTLKAGTPPPPPNAGASPAETTIAGAPSGDTLTEADKLEIAYVRAPLVEEPVMQVTKATHEAPPRPLSSAATQKIVSRHWHEPNAKKAASVSADRSIKVRQPKNGRNVDRAKATVDLRPCRGPEGFAGLLRALNLNLSPGCDT